MSNKEKTREFENWLKEQKRIAAKKYVEAVKNGNTRSTFIQIITESVLLRVLNKFREIERRENDVS
jgi:hypothetical protein